MYLTKAKLYARWTANSCIRNNTPLENLHCGTTPASKTGDYSDVKVVSPYGEIKWNNLSRISDKEMRELMLKIESNLEQQIESILGLENGGVVSYPQCEIKPNKKMILKCIKQAFFSKYGVSWDIPQREWKKMLKINNK